VVLRRGDPDLVDALALLVFVTIGVLTHEASLAAFVRDLLCFELAWFALRRLPFLPRWLAAVTLAVAVRALFVGHFSAAFYLVALAFTLLLLAASRYAVRFSATAWRRSRISSAPAPRSSRRGSAESDSRPKTRSKSGVVR
jgi:hypothetical protein